MTGLPCLWIRSISTSVSASCGIIPPVMTMSAQAMSASVSSSVLRLTSRMSQCCGSMAATVMRPSGAPGYFAPTISQVAR